MVAMVQRGSSTGGVEAGDVGFDVGAAGAAGEDEPGRLTWVEVP